MFPCTSINRYRQTSQKKRAKTNCEKLYRELLSGCDLILDDEKYFTLSGKNVSGNRLFYSTDPATTPADI
jgi:hypothetical protein